MSKLRSLILLLFVVLAASPVYAQSTTPLISLGESKELGKFLVGKDGMTLYSYPLDNVNESVCYDQCAKAWPPLMVDSADQITAAEGIPGKFATTTRKDGKLQVTYNGMPLYYWFKDAKAGDTTGHRVGRIWWVVPPATVAAEKLPKVGNVLVGPTGMTLYLWKKDTADTSTCYDQCATNWPPLTVKSADEIVPGVNLLGKFGTLTRKDNTLQVTYNGMPLYYYAKDKAIGDATGEGVGDAWYTIVPETVGVSKNKDLGDILISYDGMTLYTYAKDSEGKSTCTGDCAKAWPPFNVLPDERLAASADVKGKLETIKREDGGLQVTYNGMPLYVYAKDKVPGDATGQNVGNVWAVVKP
jgi:predicted lipoprotein with Yx(FWY)xxD motif